MASPSSILVTGADGFTGRHLCALLRTQGHAVTELTEHAPSGDHQIRAELTDAAQVRDAVLRARPERVVHLAAIAFPGHADAAAIYRVNVIGTLHLLQALAETGTGIGGVLLPSTATVYRGDASRALDEDAPLAPATHYAASKLAMEHMARQFAGQLPIVVVRLFNTTGPGQREPYLVPKIVRHFAQGAAVIELGNIDSERDFLDVRTVADAYARLIFHEAARGQTFNLCSGAGTSVRQMIGKLEAITGRGIEVRVNPAFVRPNEPRRIVGSADRLRAVIGELLAMPIGQTLRDMLDQAIHETR
ncbi:MAG: NAD-dependent epimerase/dehydratase family protein [Burkholderiales bacterium]